MPSKSESSPSSLVMEAVDSGVTGRPDMRDAPLDESFFRGVLAELTRETFLDPSLLQFRTLISACQYLKLYRLTAKYVAPGSTVLDWGAGNGHFSYFLLRSGYRTSGFNLADQPSVQITNRFGAYEYKTADLGSASLPFQNETFDAVTSVGVLEHVRETGGDELASLEEIRRVLKPHGLFICFHLPNRSSWIEASRRLVRRWCHEYRYSSEEIGELLRNANLSLVELQRYAILPRNIWSRGPLKTAGNLTPVVRMYDVFDAALSKIASPICQNYLFVAAKNRLSGPALE